MHISCCYNDRQTHCLTGRQWPSILITVDRHVFVIDCSLTRSSVTASQFFVAYLTIFTRLFPAFIRGKKRATTNSTIKSDIQKAKRKTHCFKKTEIDLHNFGLKARNRKHWRIITDSIMQLAYSDTTAYNINTGDNDTTNS